MKNLPITSLGKILDRTKLPQGANPAAGLTNAKDANPLQSSEASVVELPRTKSSLSGAEEHSAVLQSFLSEVGKQDVATAHSGLDASRVYDLLKDED